ncbi:MAG: RNA polymerase sigma factor RpoD/SigA [Planctomycetota bacterium]|nr:MAG: RNA polymerase sigma factor RpoD/SigA [Planctomycetota bacterium]
MPTSTRRRRSTSKVQAPLETYLREINETPLLTAEEERMLSYRIAQGDKEARDRMVRANLRLVVNIARSYVGRGLPLQDLIEEGNLGLLRAVEGFDPERETRFSTYASYWIKQSIKRALINTGRTIRIPAYMVELLNKWRRTTLILYDRLGRMPTEQEVAQELKLSRRKLSIVKQAIQLNSAPPQTDHPDGMAISDIVPDDRRKNPEETLVDSDAMKKAFELLGDVLEEREEMILRMRFGLGDEEPMTLKDIGDRLGLTRERVRQIEHKALRKLRRCLEGE